MPLDLYALAATIETRLPRRARWYIEDTTVDFHFSATIREARGALDYSGPFEHEWSDHLVIGRYDFAEGGGAAPFITVRQADGYVCGLDLERRGPSVFAFNSSIGLFVDTFLLLHEHFARGERPPRELEVLGYAVEPAGMAGCEWGSLVQYLMGS